MGDRYRDLREEHLWKMLDHAKGKELHSTVVDLATIGKQDEVELAEVHKLFQKAGLTPKKSEKLLPASEFAQKFMAVAKNVQIIRNKVFIRVEGKGNSFIYVGMTWQFYQKYFEYEKISGRVKKQ